MSIDRTTVVTRLTEVFRDVFDDSEIELTNEMTTSDIDEWDSLAHITLIVAIETEFEIQFNTAEVGNLENVGEMIDILAERAAK